MQYLFRKGKPVSKLKAMFVNFFMDLLNTLRVKLLLQLIMGFKLAQMFANCAVETDVTL